MSACLACGASVWSAWLAELWFIMWLAAAGVATSFFYWRRPVFNGLARKLDVWVILTGFNSQLYLLYMGMGTAPVYWLLLAFLFYSGV